MNTDFQNSDDYKRYFYSTNNRTEQYHAVAGLNLKNHLTGTQKTNTQEWLPLPTIKEAISFLIKDKPRDLVGLQSNNFEDVDEAKITVYLTRLLCIGNYF